MRKALFTLLVIVFFLIPTLAAATAESITEGTMTRVHGTDIWYTDIVWVADSGDASFDVQTGSTFHIGYLVALHATFGATAPTINSDLDLFHSVGGTVTVSEILGAQGDNIVDATTSNFVTLTTPVMINGVLGLDIENNSVNAGTGTVRLYFRIPDAN